MPEQVIRNRPRDATPSRAPAASEPGRLRAGLGPDEDPLVELARIVNDGAANLARVSTEAPTAAVDTTPTPRRDYPRRDTSWRDPTAQTTVVRAGITPQPMPGQLEDLEAELFSELRTAMPGGGDDRRRITDVDPRSEVTQMMAPRTSRSSPPAPSVMSQARQQPPQPQPSAEQGRRAPPLAAQPTFAPGSSSIDDDVTLPIGAALREAHMAARKQQAPIPAAVSVPMPPPPQSAPEAYDDLGYDQYYDQDPAGALHGGAPAFAPAAGVYPPPAPVDYEAPDIDAYRDRYEEHKAEGYGHDEAGHFDPTLAARLAPGAQSTVRADSRLINAPRRGWKTMAAAALGVLLLAGVSFAGYRMLVGGTGFSGGLPLIKADTKPVKEMPLASSQPATVASGPNLDASRSDDASKLVTRQEDPVDQVPGKPSVRQVGGAATGNLPAPQKVVRTVIVRTDGSIVGSEADTPKPSTTPARVASPETTASTDPLAVLPTRADPNPLVPLQPATTTPAKAGASDKPMPVFVIPKPPAGMAPYKPAATPAPAPAPVVKAAVPPKPAAAPAPSLLAKPVTTTSLPAKPAASAQDGGPLSLAPAAAPSRVATYTPPAPAASATPKPAAIDAGSGDFMVQISSQRSDGEARRALQDATRKYAGLGVKGGDVQQADLGSRGTYYRARLSAGSREQAQALCSQIKAQGGDCVVGKR